MDEGAASREISRILNGGDMDALLPLVYGRARVPNVQICTSIGVHHVPLRERLEDGSFTMQTDDMLAEEIGLFVKTLDGITSTVTSDHIMNLLEEVSGKLPDDKEKMLGIIQAYQALSDTDRLIYRAGRRGGAYRSTADLKQDPATYQKIKNLIQEVEQKEGPQGVEKMLAEMVDQYI